MSAVKDALRKAYDRVERQVDGKVTHPFLKPLRDHPFTAAILIGALVGVIVLLLVFGAPTVPDFPQ